jgi:predicted RNase H-like nuclease
MCYTAIDATGFGGKMFREALESSVANITNVEFGGTVQKKRMLLGDLRTMIDEGRLLLPAQGAWAQVRKQLLQYKLDDRKIEQDAVMALVCAVYLLRRTPVDGRMSTEFRL